MNDEQPTGPQQDDDFEDVMADDCEMPTVDEYRLSTRPGVVSGDS